MKAVKLILVSLSAVLICSGCAKPTYLFTIDSHPQGATVYCKFAEGTRALGSTPIGFAPETVDVANSVVKQIVSTCFAQWVSGATAAYKPEHVAPYMDQHYGRQGLKATVERPRNAKGYQQDAEFELKVQQAQAQQAAATAAQRQAAAAESQAIAAQQQAASAVIQATTPVRLQTNCITTYGMTTCY